MIGCAIWKEFWPFFIITDTATDYPYNYADSETVIGGLCLPWIRSYLSGSSMDSRGLLKYLVDPIALKF